MQNTDIYLSIVIPAYNEEVNISSTLKDIAEYLKSKDYSYELIVVDDGSIDGTVGIVYSVAPIFESFTLLKNPVNRGKGYSVKRGVLFAKGELILVMDADNSTRIDQIEKLLSAIEQGYDVAIGSRRARGSVIEIPQPLHRFILGGIYILLSKLILGASVNDYNCGFKLYARGVVQPLFSRLTMDRWSFDTELIFLISKLKFKIKEVPIVWQDHRKTSKVRPFRDGISAFLALFKMRWRAARGLYK